jgi:hypothetical protein
MKLIQVIIACAVMFIVTAAPAKAEIIKQSWESFEFVQTDDFDCAGEDGLAQGMVHTTIANMPQGGLSIHALQRGTWTGFDTGNEFKWLHNYTDVLPINGENVVWTIQQRVRVLGQGPGNDLFVKWKYHVTDIGGEVTVYVDSLTFECTVD